MAQKKPFVLRLDPEVLKAVEKWAADEFRSTNGQLEWIISKALKDANIITYITSPDQKSPEGATLI